jgi:hypothetical protein
VEVVPSIVPVGTLTRLESMSEMLGLAVVISEVLDISLSEVQAQYFGGSGMSVGVFRVVQFIPTYDCLVSSSISLVLHNTSCPMSLK